MAKLTLQPGLAGHRISPMIYGHFIEHLGGCVYGGIWAGQRSSIPNTDGLRDDVVEALRRVRPPVLRWPGGCFADDYCWRDGVGLRGQRPRRVNIHWGQIVETNEFGTDDFIRLCRATGAEPYICGNVGSGSPRELRDWVEYCNQPAGTAQSEMRVANGSAQPFAVRFWGIGNENWGCGGNMTPEYYGDLYRRFATYTAAFGGTRPFRIACGPSGHDTDWTRRLLHRLFRDYRSGPGVEGLAAHYYCGGAGAATQFSEAQWYGLLHNAAFIETLITEQRALMDEFDPERRIKLVVDEWGAWHEGLPAEDLPLLWQQNTVRDALVAALTLDIFNRHADSVFMANLAQTVNVLQSLILTDGPRMVLTPTFYVYEMYADHQGGQSVPLRLESDEVSFEGAEGPRTIPCLAASASRKETALTVTLTNAHAREAREVEIVLKDARVAEVQAQVLRGGAIQAHNTFDEPREVMPRPARAPEGAGELSVTLAPASVTKLAMKLS